MKKRKKRVWIKLVRMRGGVLTLDGKHTMIAYLNDKKLKAAAEYKTALRFFNKHGIPHTGGLSPRYGKGFGKKSNPYAYLVKSVHGKELTPNLIRDLAIQYEKMKKPLRSAYSARQQRSYTVEKFITWLTSHL